MSSGSEQTTFADYGIQTKYPWRDEETLELLYRGKSMTMKQIGDELGCSPSTVYKWLVEHDLEIRSDPTKTEPYRDKETLEKLYWVEKLSMSEIADRLDTSLTTVHYWMNEHDIERRTRNKGGWDSPRMKPYARFTTSPQGYEQWESNFKNERDTLRHHRLLAVARFGFDAVKDKIVHHKNNITWDNRIENLELMTRGEHSKMHQSARVRRKRDYTNIDKE